jgi:hypothetical protein
MVDMTLVPEAAWREARRRAGVVRPQRQRSYPPRRTIEEDFGKPLKPTLENDTCVVDI